MFSTHKYPKAVLGSSGSHLYPRKVRTNLQVLEADIRPPYWVSWRSGNEQDDRDLITSLSLSFPCFPLDSPPICSCIVWLAKWCKIHKVYMPSHSMFLLIFTNIFIHIQQPNLHSRNIFIHIYLCISYSIIFAHFYEMSRIHSHPTSYIHSHSRSKYSFNIFCAPPLRIGQYKI